MKNLIFTIAAFLLFAPAAFAQGSIEGTITDAKGAGVVGVTVTVVGADGKAIATAKTEESGAYTFDEIAAGVYKVVATASSGYKPAFRDDIAVGDDETTTLDITLDGVVQAPVPKPTVKPEPPKIIAPKPRPGINVQVGQKFSVATKSETFTETTMLGRPVEIIMIEKYTRIYEVVAVEPDVITLKATISSLRFDLNFNGQKHSFDSSRNDNYPGFAEVAGRKIARVRTVSISRSGQVIKDDEPLEDGLGNTLDMNKGRVEIFEPDLTLPELKAGAVIPSRGDPATTKNGSYTVGLASGGTANVSYAGKSQLTPAVFAQMAAAGVELGSQSTWTEQERSNMQITQRSDLQIDAGSRVVVSRETTDDFTTVNNTSTMGAVLFKAKVTVSEKVTRLN